MDYKEEFAARLQAIIDSAIDGIITIDSKGVIESVNPAAAEIFGYEKDDIIGKNITVLMPSPYAEEHDGYIKQYEKTRKPKIIGIGREVKGLTKDGRIFPFRLAVSEVILNDKVIYTGIIHDLTEISEAQKEILRINKELEEKVEERTSELEQVVNRLLETNQNLTVEVEKREEITQKLRIREKELSESLDKEKELNELKSRFVSMASHEFRTPLTSIMSSASLISRYNLENQEDKRKKHIDRIKSAVANLTGILNDFLSLSKLEEGKIDITLEDVNLEDLAQSVVEDLSTILKRGQQILVKSGIESPSVLSDPRILKNIFFNLLSNAIKYSDKDIHFLITQEKREYIIEVVDKGIGIPEADQKHLFTRFFRASNSINIQGTGLGLNIVKRYVSLLQGHISFLSTYGEGTTFKITLPLLDE